MEKTVSKSILAYSIMNTTSFKTILFTALAIIISSCANKTDTGSEITPNAENATLYGTEFFNGKVKAIIYSNEKRRDSLAFVYNKNCEVERVEYYSDNEKNGFCRYDYNGPNRIDLYNFNKLGVETSREVVQFNDNKQITLYCLYSHIFPDTTRMELLFLKQNSYDKTGHKESAFEYHCDGIPPYNYHYTYNNDGTETEVRTLTATGNIYTVTKRKRDYKGNIIEQSENMPQDNCEWDSIKIEYKYDNKGNWIKRKVTSLSSQEYLNEDVIREIYYIDK